MARKFKKEEPSKRQNDMNDKTDIFRGVGIEITLKEQDDFLKVRETLTRIGVSSRKEKM